MFIEKVKVSFWISFDRGRHRFELECTLNVEPLVIEWLIYSCCLGNNTLFYTTIYLIWLLTNEKSRNPWSTKRKDVRKETYTLICFIHIYFCCINWNYLIIISLEALLCTSLQKKKFVWTTIRGNLEILISISLELPF